MQVQHPDAQSNRWWMRADRWHRGVRLTPAPALRLDHAECILLGKHRLVSKKRFLLSPTLRLDYQDRPPLNKIFLKAKLKKHTDFP
jgi:hypothetical protein